MRSSAFLVAFVGVLTFLPACSQSKTCSLLGCESSATIRMFANLSRQQLEGATITACRNNACSSGVPTTVPSAPNDRLAVTLSGPVAAQGFLTAPDPTKGFRIEATFTLEGLSTQDGDVYELRVTPAGTTTPVAVASDKATYTDSQPNGEDCPPVCKTVVIEK